MEPFLYFLTYVVQVIGLVLIPIGLALLITSSPKGPRQ